MNLRNTRAIAAGAKKSRYNRGSGEPAFARPLGVVRVELRVVDPGTKRQAGTVRVREIESHLHGRGNLLDAQTPTTAAREVIKDWPKMRRPTSKLLAKHIAITNP